MRRTLLHETPRAGAAHITGTLLPGRRSLPRVDARVKGHGCLDWDSTNGGCLARTFRDPTAAGRSAPRDGRGGLRQRRRSPWPPPRSQSPRAPTVFRWGLARASKETPHCRPQHARSGVARPHSACPWGFGCPPLQGADGGKCGRGRPRSRSGALRAPSGTGRARAE